MMDFSQIKKAAEGYQTAMTKFLRDLIAIPGESCEEEGVVKRIAQEMEAVGFDKVEIDKMGNVMGYLGHARVCERLVQDGFKAVLVIKRVACDNHIVVIGRGLNFFQRLRIRLTNNLLCFRKPVLVGKFRAVVNDSQLKIQNRTDF